MLLALKFLKMLKVLVTTPVDDLDRSARSVVAENTVPGTEVLHTSMDGDGRTSNAAPLDQVSMSSTGVLELSAFS